MTDAERSDLEDLRRVQRWAPAVYLFVGAALLLVGQSAQGRAAGVSPTPGAVLPGWVLLVLSSASLAGLLRAIVGRIERSLEALVKVRRQYRTLVDRSPTATVVSVGLKMLYGNEAALRLLHLGRLEELVGRSPLEFLASEHQDDVRERVRLMGLGQEPPPDFVRRRYLLHDGAQLLADVAAAPIEWEGQAAAQVVLHDVTTQVELEERTRRLNAALRVLSAGNEAVVRARSEEELLPAVCRAAVAHGELALAWVGFFDPRRPAELHLAAHAGADQSVLDWIRQGWAEAWKGPQRPGDAPGVLVVDDIKHDPRVALWSEDSSRRGYASLLTLQVPGLGPLPGVVTFVSSRTGAFDSQTVEVMQQLVDNVGYGLEALRSRQRADAAEKALQSTALEYQAIIDGAPVYVFSKDAEGRYEVTNQVTDRLLGRGKGGARGLTDRELMPAGLAERLEAQDREVQETQRTLQYEDVLGERVIFITKFPRLDARGQVTGIIGVATDVTELRKSQRAAQESNLKAAARAAELSAIFEVMDDAIVVYDTDGVARAANPAATEVFGFDPVGLAEWQIGRRLGVPVNPGDATPVLQVLRGERIENLEVRAGGAEPGIRSLTARKVVDAAGQVMGVVVIARDVTERVRAAEALRSLAGRLQTVREEEKGRIARDLHDDLGQALTALKLQLSAMEQRIADAPAQPFVNTLLDQTVEAGLLVDGLTARVQQIAQDLRPAALDSLGLGPALRSEARAFTARTGVPCEVRVDEPPLSGEVAEALYRIAQESLTNVTRHARASRTYLTLEDGVRAVVMRVEDDGVGFEPAAAVQSLGLLGMRERAAAVEGSLEVRRRVPRGTVVEVQVPKGRVG